MGQMHTTAQLERGPPGRGRCSKWGHQQALACVAIRSMLGVSQRVQIQSLRRHRPHTRPEKSLYQSTMRSFEGEKGVECSPAFLRTCLTSVGKCPWNVTDISSDLAKTVSCLRPRSVG